MTIGKAIKLLRVRRGWKQQEFAKMLNMSPSYLSLVERDKRDIKMSTLQKICKGANISPVVLISLVDEDLNQELKEKLYATFLEWKNLPVFPFLGVFIYGL